MNRAALTADIGTIPAAQRAWLPSWGASIVFHAVLWVVLLWVSQWQSCRGDMSGEGGEDFRKVGIRVESQGSGGQGATVVPPGPTAVSPPPETVVTLSTAPALEMPLASAWLPQAANVPPLLGPGPPLSLPPVNANSAPAAFVPRAIGLPGAGAPEGGTAFFGAGDVGKRFVYVIDRSASMGADNALQSAKSELLGSIELLKEHQQFQVIFYNSDFSVMRPRGDRAEMFQGNSAQRLQVSQQLLEILPTGATSHLPALLKALSFNPDVVFLLTDGADTSALSPGDLKQVQQHNRSGAHIHTIEFGHDAQSPLTANGNFLQDLARQNQGRYIYRQIAATN